MPESSWIETAAAHANQKPISLMERQILAATDIDDVVWEPFGGLCSISVAALRLGRRVYASEINSDYFRIARERIATEMAARLA
jgi:site-specific DNA-methyltransferase (adenine-specific)